jgi:hypothetical protein
MKGVTEDPPKPVYLAKDIFEPQIRPPRTFQRTIGILNRSSCVRTLKTGTLTVDTASIYNINNAFEAKDFKERPLEEMVLEQYHEFLPLFRKVLADRLSPHLPGIDHEVRLKDEKSPTWGPYYSMSRAELVVLKAWLEENMTKRFIRQSSSPFAAPVSFRKKPEGGLSFCIDYRDI